MHKRYNLDLEKQLTPHKATTSPIENVVEDLLKVYQLKKKFSELEVTDAWKSVTNPIVGKRTVRVYVQENTMFVKLESASLKNELLMRKTQLIKDLNQKVGQDIIKTLIFL